MAERINVRTDDSRRRSPPLNRTWAESPRAAIPGLTPKGNCLTYADAAVITKAVRTALAS
jgi:hypothetical protein